MSRRFTAGGQVAIVGHAISDIRRRHESSLGVLTVKTCLDALRDAGIPKERLDGLTSGTLLPASGDHRIEDGISIVTPQWLARHLGVAPRFCAAFQGLGQLPGAVMLAVNAIAAGSADYVLVYRAMFNPTTRYNESGLSEARGEAQWTAPHGFWGAVNNFALPYREYLERYGARREAMAPVAVEARRNGASLPWSYWRGKPLDERDYLEGRLVADPLSLLDCDIPVTGVGAFVLTRADRAAESPHRPVYVAGYAQARAPGPEIRSHATLDDLMDSCFGMATRLWQHTGLTADDVDLPQLYDGFSPFIYFYLEGLGFCGLGEAHQFVQDGNIDRDKGLPILSGGGSLGNGRMHGIPQMLECYLQLSRRASHRQLPKAEVGLACHGSPSAGGAVLYTSEPC